jgi:Spy/CpxP family protein refolding chaperone
VQDTVGCLEFLHAIALTRRAILLDISWQFLALADPGRDYCSSSPNTWRTMMRKTLLSAVALGLACQLALADRPAGPPRGGPPVDQIATQLGLNDYQKAEMERIFGEAHARMEAERKASMAQVDAELANVLTAEQIAEFKKLMQERRRDRRGPPSDPPPST